MQASQEEKRRSDSRHARRKRSRAVYAVQSNVPEPDRDAACLLNVVGPVARQIASNRSQKSIPPACTPTDGALHNTHVLSVKPMRSAATEVHQSDDTVAAAMLLMEKYPTYSNLSDHADGKLRKVAASYSRRHPEPGNSDNAGKGMPPGTVSIKQGKAAIYGTRQ